MQDLLRLVIRLNGIEDDLMNLPLVIKAPSIIGFNEPNFDTINPEVGPKTKIIMANGSLTVQYDSIFAKSNWPGFLTNDWYCLKNHEHRQSN